MKGLEKKAIHLLLQKAEALYSRCPTSFSIQEIPEYVDDSLQKSNVNVTHKNEENATLRNLSNNILSCTRCSLNNENRFIGTGVEKPQVLIITDIQDDNKDIEKLLLKMISAINLFTDRNCYITNLLKCSTNNKPIQNEQVESCLSFFNAQLSVLKPSLILGFGEIPAQVLLKTKDSINNLRGNFFEYKTIPIIFTYHPRDLLKNVALKSPAWADLKRIKAKLESDSQKLNSI